MSNFTVYKSSAGSGKTFTLVREYLKLALSDPADPPQHYKHILAITFTNKAASEMKSRIVDALKELAKPSLYPNSSLMTLLSQDLLLDPFVLADRAQAVLTAILHNYTDFAIGTIDAFVHRIVRAFAFDLHLPVNFEVETDADKLLRDAVNLLVARIGDDDQLTEVLVQFAESKAEEDRSWQIENELLNMARHLLAEEEARKAEQLRVLNLTDFLRMRDRLRTVVRQFSAEISGKAQLVIDRLNAQGISETSFYQGSRGLPVWFKALADGEINKLAEPNTYVTETIENDKWYSGKASASEKSAIDALRPFITEVWNQLMQMREEHYSQFTVRRLILKNIYALAALNEIEKLIYSFRAEQNIVHISEFNRIISRIVFAEPVPFIYERLGERYENYLIDEFQDTSVLQWQNLLPLIDNALGNGNFTMLVGDGKQAIYRWRGGEVEQFARLPQLTAHIENDLVAEREQSLKRNFRDKHLSKNYRSKAEIVQFNNTLFRLLSTRLDRKWQSIYAELEQEYNPENMGGYIKIERIEANQQEEHIHKTISSVRELVAEGWALQDIAVLTRTNKEGSLIATALLEANFPVISSESLLIQQSAKVRFILAILKYIHQPDDAIVAAEIMHFLVNNKKSDESFNTYLFMLKTKTPEEIIRLKNTAFSVVHLAKMPLYQRCEEIIRCFNLDGQPDAYLLFFLDEVLNYSRRNGNDTSDFIVWWNEKRKKASIVVPEGMNAVRVMTIHKAKGLEFPIVIFPYADWKFDKNRKDIWVNISDELLPGMKTTVLPLTKDLQHTAYAELYEDEENKSLLDHLNVLYVALTRAEKRLYIFTGTPAKTSTKELKTASDCFTLYWNAKSSPSDVLLEEGILAQSSSERKKNTSFLHARKIISSNWTNRISIRSQATDLWDSDSTVKTKDDFHLLRLFFSYCRSASDLDRAMKKIIGNGYADATQAFLVRQKAATIVNEPSVKPYFSADRYAQTNAELILSPIDIKKYDRIVWMPDGSVVCMQLKDESGFKILIQ